MPATLIFDNANPSQLIVPPEMGEPAPDQLQGTPWDNLCELSGRVCYDSLGRGRSSAAYHQHIREVVNLSVYRHATFTILMDRVIPAVVFLNRPSLWVEVDGPCWRVTLNLQHVREWDYWGVPGVGGNGLAVGLAGIARRFAPLSCGDLKFDTENEDYGLIRYVEPRSEGERWLSFFVTGVSRGLSHELVRHTAYCAPSQRSTRYCDESDSPWIWHPLIDGIPIGTLAALRNAQHECQAVYDRVVHDLTEQGHDRKAARGAARGVLGNALGTELIFSASLAQWRRIVKQRNHPLADGEIKRLAAEIEAQLPAA